MPVTYHVEVHRKNIARMFLPSGDAGSWIHKVTVHQMREARASAPSRTGGLKNAHRIERVAVGGAFFANQYVAAYEIRNESPHAEYVHDGTRSQDGVRVLPPGGPGKNTVSPWKGQMFGKKVMKKGVRGQNANPWLENACTRVAERYGSTPYRI